MANTDKNIVITPNNGSASDPNIVFSGANASIGPQNITLTVTPNNSGTVAFSGSAGQLFAINNDIANTLSTGGTISATGNITANNFVGNLVGNVTGNISGSLANGNSNVSIPAANGNINISAVGNANIVVVTGTGANIAGTLSVSGNANVGNIGATNGVFTNVSGNGSSLSSITGANVTGQVGNALVAGTVYTNAQPNITSLGTLTTLSVSGNANVGNLGTAGLITATGNITGGNLIGTSVTGTLTTAAQPNITSVGTLTSLSVTGNITANNISIGNVETVGVFTRYSNVTFLDNANAVAGNRVVVTMPAPATVNGMYSGVLKVYAIRQFDNPGGPRSQTTFKLSRVGNTSGANATFYVNEAVVDKTSAFAFQWYFDTTTGTPSLVIGQNTNSYNWYVESELNTSTIPTIAIGSNAGSYGTSYYPLYTLATPGTDAGGLTITASNSSNTMVFDSTGQLSLAGNITANNFVGNLVGNVTGNFSGSLANGNSNISIPAANGNVNISAGGTPNELVITSTGINVAGTLNATGNANVGNIGATNGVFTNVSGNGSSLSFITGANVTGQVGNALVAGTVYTAAQPNITSVGTLSSLSVSGTATLAAVNGTDASFSGNATVNGNLFVNGNLTYLNVETVAVEDPIIQLQTGANGAAPIANSGKDVGTALNYYDTAAKIAFMGWDVSNAEIAFGSNVSITNEVVTFTSLANTRSGNTLTTGVFATTLSATGNITGGNLIGVFANGNSNISIPAANGNINFSIGGQANEVVFTSTGANVNGYLSVSGNANIANIGTAGLITATGNITGGNLITSGLISATGGLTASSYTAANSLLGYFLANAGTTVGKVYENGNLIKLQSELANYGVALAANGTVQLSFDANGYGAIGSSSGTTGYALRIAKQTTGATTAGSILINPTVQTDVTSTALGVRTSLSTAAGASPYTINNLVGYATYGGTIGANTTVTTHIAYYVDSSANTGATNYGFYGGLASAASTFNLYMTGTANNYLGGSLGIGSTSLGAINMRVSKPLTGGTTAFNFVSDGVIQSDVTTNAVLNRVVGQTQAATFTLTNLIYNQAVQGTFGAASNVTTQSGFVADNTLIGATNNYGFRGSIASGANRFNLYMDGSANNYIAGNFGIGTTSPAVALHVKQNAGSINVEGTDQAFIQFYPRGMATRTSYIGVGSAGSNNFTIRNDDTGRLALESGNSNVSVFANGNVTTTVAGVANVLVVTSTGANIAGTLSATGNITGNFFIGNGSQLTGITTATSLANGTSNVSIPAVNGNVNISVGGSANEVVVTSTGANVNGYLNVTGNTTFSGVGQRIFGDFSNATIASRTVLQSSTANTATDIPILPNGTAAAGSSLNTFNLSNIANSAYAVIGANSTVSRLYSATTGTATLLPLAFGVGSTEAARFDTGGNLLVGTTNANGANNITTSIIGGIHQTIKGQVTPASGVATTIFTIPSQNFSTWMITVQLAAADTANYSAWAMIATQTGSVRIMTNVAGPLLTISNSGLAIQATQSSGTSSTIYYSAIRIM